MSHNLESLITPQHLMNAYYRRARRIIQEIFENNEIINDDLLVETKIRDVSNHIRNMVTRRREHLREMQSSNPINYPRNRKPIIKVKLVSLFALNTPCKSSCAICHETHVRVDSLTTDCNHEFGKDCYNEWITRGNSCPICRNVCKNVTVYKGDKKHNVDDELVDVDVDDVVVNVDV